MSRKLIALVAALTAALVAVPTSAAPPDPPKLPLLPPPGKEPPPAKKPDADPKVDPKAKAPAANLMPVEFSVAVADLEQQLLRGLFQKIDPKAEPVLPFVLKGNEKDFGVPQADPVPANPPVMNPAPAGGTPILDALREFRENRPRLLPGRRPPPMPVPVPLPVPVPAPVGPVIPAGGIMPPERGIIPRVGTLVGGIMARASAGVVVGAIDAVKNAFTVDLAYRIELRDFKLTIVGNTLTSELTCGFHCESVPKPGVPAPPVVNVRDATFKVAVVKELEWSDEGKLELRNGTTKLWIDPDAPLVGFPRLGLERVLRLNGLLDLLDGVLDRQVMKRLPADDLPDLAGLAPKLKEKLPFMAVSEIAAYPLVSDGKDLRISLGVALVPAAQKPEKVKVTVLKGPPPEPKLRGRIVFDKDGKPDVKIGVP